MLPKSSDMLNKNTLGVQRVQGQLKAALQTGSCATKNFEARKLHTLSKILLTP